MPSKTSKKSENAISKDFAFVAAHQLKTPLTALRWYTGELMNSGKQNLPSDAFKALMEIRFTVQQMTDMLNALLRIGRIRSGRLNIEPMPLDIVSAVKDAALSLDAEVQEKKLAITVVSRPQVLPQVPMDKDILGHVLRNLLENAVKYSHTEGRIEVVIKLLDGHLEIAVKDFGIGIPERDQKNIFTEFFRARNATAFQPRGTGLGLPLAKYLVEHWKGKIWFSSKENKGTTFYFTLPTKGIKAQKGEVTLSA